MTRAVWPWLARRVPSRAVTNRLVPWITLFLGAAGAVWTLFQYSNSVGIQRSATTLTIHRQFLVTFPEGAQEITGLSAEAQTIETFRVRCNVYRVAMENGVLSPNEMLSDCMAVTLADRSLLDEIGAEAPEAVREQIRTALDTTVLTKTAPARRMMTYFRSLQVCVERHQCDPEITSELFAGDIVAFLNITCALAERDAEFMRQGKMLGRFARSLLADGTILWNTDPHRMDLFRCNHLRLRNALVDID